MGVREWISSAPDIQMTKQEIMDTYGQSVYQIKLSIAMAQYGQLIARSGIGSATIEKMDTLATQALQSGTTFVKALMDEKMISN
jgi:hypothetical protein